MVDKQKVIYKLRFKVHIMQKKADNVEKRKRDIKLILALILIVNCLKMGSKPNENRGIFSIFNFRGEDNRNKGQFCDFSFKNEGQ